MKSIYVILTLASLLALPGTALANTGIEVVDEPLCRGIGVNCDEEICEEEWNPDTQRWEETCTREKCTVYYSGRCQVVVGDLLQVKENIELPVAE